MTCKPSLQLPGDKQTVVESSVDLMQKLMATILETVERCRKHIGKLLKILLSMISLRVESFEVDDDS